MWAMNPNPRKHIIPRPLMCGCGAAAASRLTRARHSAENLPLAASNYLPTNSGLDLGGGGVG
ncbi:hypothetical protein E2C01_068747 [Portunus trituberculatus]|uniref:Uncharacterized protein n=1 Tax=Portunus trituberculatus TaxID=210409 RepID=A0A5B7HXA3_PORTR|nr:hypothetical protein [Portunus trituberculatus]